MRTAFVIAIAAICSPSNANDYQGFVSSVFAYGGLVYVFVGTGNFGSGGPGACPNGGNMIYSVDPNTAYGRVLIALAISARVASRQAYFQGNGVCALGPGAYAEALSAMNLE